MSWPLPAQHTRFWCFFAFSSYMQRNNISVKSFLWIFPLFSCLFYSCSGPEKAEVKVEYLDLYSDLSLFADKTAKPEDINSLKSKYGIIFDRWFFVIMGLTEDRLMNDSQISGYVSKIAAINKPVFRVVNAHYSKYPKLKADIETGLSRLGAEFPDARNFIVVPYISQFSYYTTFADTWKGKQVLGYSAEMFLNDTFAFYLQNSEEFPSWIRRYVRTEQLPPSLVANYLKSRYESRYQTKNMISEAIFEGKLWYSMQLLFPEISPDRLFGYSKEEWKFLEQEESNMWQFFIRENVLFNTNFQQGYKRYFVHGEQTTGAGLPEKCPPRIGCFAGYKIVKAYAKKTGKGLKEIWEHTDASSFLQTSGYNPVR